MVPLNSLTSWRKSATDSVGVAGAGGGVGVGVGTGVGSGTGPGTGVGMARLAWARVGGLPRRPLISCMLNDLLVFHLNLSSLDTILTLPKPSCTDSPHFLTNSLIPKL